MVFDSPIRRIPLHASCRVWAWALIAVALCLGSLPDLLAQDTSKSKTKASKTSAEDPSSPPPLQELELARLDHQRQVLAASLNPLKSTLSRLDELARARAKLRDYEGAIAARAERQQIETELERIAKELLLLETREKALKTALLPDRILLPLAEARLDGVRWDAEKQRLTQWERPGSFAEWKLPGLPPGGYEILLTYQCNPIEGGTLLIAEKTFTLTGEMDTTLRGPEIKNLGTLKLTDGSGFLRLTARTIVKSNLMDLIAVEMVPANR